MVELQWLQESSQIDADNAVAVAVVVAVAADAVAAVAAVPVDGTGMATWTGLGEAVASRASCPMRERQTKCWEACLNACREAFQCQY